MPVIFLITSFSHSANKTGHCGRRRNTTTAKNQYLSCNNEEDTFCGLLHCKNHVLQQFNSTSLLVVQETESGDQCLSRSGDQNVIDQGNRDHTLCLITFSHNGTMTETMSPSSRNVSITYYIMIMIITFAFTYMYWMEYIFTSYFVNARNTMWLGFTVWGRRGQGFHSYLAWWLALT